jgi:hypothetical protein
MQSFPRISRFCLALLSKVIVEFFHNLIPALLKSPGRVFVRELLVS